MSRFSVSPIPALALAGLAFVSTVFLVAASAQTQLSPSMRAEAISLMKICRSDYDRLCAGVQPGGGRVLACLHEHSHQVSTACGQALPRAEAFKNGAAAAGTAPK